MLDPAWELRGAGWNGWNVQVDGDAPLDVDIRFKIPEGRMGEMTPGYTANRAGQRDPLRVRRRAGHPHHRRPAADHPGA